MKNLFKYFFVFALLIFLTIKLITFLYSNVVYNNLDVKKESIKNNWREFLNSMQIRDAIFNASFDTINLKKIVNIEYVYFSDSLKLVEYNEFIKNETLINNPKLSKQEFKTLDSINNNLNLKIYIHNEIIQNFNVYRSTFPNNVIAKKKKIKNMKYFRIKYGEKNNNPLEKSNVEKWVETGNARYIE